MGQLNVVSVTVVDTKKFLSYLPTNTTCCCRSHSYRPIALEMFILTISTSSSTLDQPKYLQCLSVLFSVCYLHTVPTDNHSLRC
jgi:hypothetical protein